MRRPLSIPDPVRYLLLLDSLIAGWPDFLRLYGSSNLSLTRPRRDHLGHRAFTFKTGFSSQPIDFAQVRSGARYVLQADINQFYPSIYTHAIPWAIHGKAFAKAHRSPVHVGNLIDERVRNGQDGQTMGVPIGPDSSFLIAEALLGSLDSKVQAAMGGRPGLRMLDAYEFAFDSYTAAEEGIAVLQDTLSAYELALNPRKTGIAECPIPLEKTWATNLKSIALPDSGSVPRRLLIAFIDRAFELTGTNRGESILNWTLSRLMSLTISLDQWRIVEPLIYQAAASEPGALPRCLRLLLNAHLKAYPIDRTRLHAALTTITSNSVRRGHGSEASWGVWGHILFSLPLDSTLVSELSTFDEDVVALVTLDARNRGLVPATVSFPLWEGNVSTAGLGDGHWLLAYEAIAQGWVAPPINPVAADPAFSDLFGRGVSFYSLGSPDLLTLSHAHSAPSWMTAAESYLL